MLDATTGDPIRLSVCVDAAPRPEGAFEIVGLRAADGVPVVALLVDELVDPEVDVGASLHRTLERWRLHECEPSALAATVTKRRAERPLPPR